MELHFVPRLAYFLSYNLEVRDLPVPEAKNLLFWMAYFRQNQFKSDDGGELEVTTGLGEDLERITSESRLSETIGS